VISAENSTEDTVDYGTFTIQAPEMAGRYTFFSLIIVNPHEPRSEQNFFPLDISLPFIIEVIE
jgi:hypothetical protein